MRLVAALRIVVLLYYATALHAPSALAYAIHPAHACASPIPSAVPGSPTPVPATPGIILINEVLSAPASTWNCSENGTFSLMSDAWVELYNPQSQPFDLYAVQTSLDTGPNSYAYYLPFGAAIAPHGYLPLFPNVNSQTIIAGATLRLVISSTIIDQVSIPALTPDFSYARIPDGSNTWQITNTPTIDASNVSSQLNPTPTPTSSSTSSSPTTSSSGDSHGSHTTNGYSPKTLINGTQPKWSNIQLPGSTTISSNSTSTSSDNAQPTTAGTPSPTTNNSDLPHHILLTLLAIALILMLFWCYRLFTNS